MRLTAEHVRRAVQFTNTMLEREIDLRGLRISSLDENALVLLENKFDVVNLTANALSSLQYFPLRDTAAKQDTRMLRVGTLIVHRNDLQKVSVPSCVMAVPNVRCFLADNNSFSTVRSLLFLKYWKKLEVVSFEHNPVLERNEEHYDEPTLRAFLVHMCPKLKLINYQRVTAADRQLAKGLATSFNSTVSSLEAPNGGMPSDGAGQKKLRKRGRDAPNVSGASTTTTATTTAQLSVSHGEKEAPLSDDRAATADTDHTDYLQERLDQIEARILSDDVTAEDIMSLEQEMNELTAEMEMRKKRRKA